MSVELPMHPNYKDVSYTPISFAVSPMPEQGAFLSMPHEPLPTKHREGRSPSQHVTATPPPFRSSMRPSSRSSSSRSSSSRPSLMTAPAMQPRRSSYIAQPPREQVAEADLVLQPYPISWGVPESHRSVPALAKPPQASSLAIPKPAAAPSLMPTPSAAKPVAQTAAKSTVASSSKHHARFTILKSIGTLKWGTMALTSTLFAAAFATYGWTVSLERRGSDLNEQLTQLRAHEKGMTGMAAALGASMADDSQKPESGLRLPSPGGVFPLELEEPRPAVTEEDAVDEVPPFRRNKPRGY